MPRDDLHAPWQVGECVVQGWTEIRDSEGALVALVYGQKTAGVMAAAPETLRQRDELLAAAVKAVACHEDEMTLDVRWTLEAAIAKARGEDYPPPASEQRLYLPTCDSLPLRDARARYPSSRTGTMIEDHSLD